MTTFNDAYNAAVSADDKWMEEIEKAFPGQWPGDVRYQPEAQGFPGTPLRAAYDEYLRTRTTFEAALSLCRPSAA
jgi:hypothetical protein